MESFAAPLVTTGPVPVREIKDPALAKGKRVVDVYGSPPRSTSVHRVVYGPNGKVMYDSTWSSRYVAEPSVVRVGTKPPAKKKPKPAVDEASATQPAGPDPAPSTEPTTTPVAPQQR